MKAMKGKKKPTITKTLLIQFQLFIYKPACLQIYFHERVLSIRVFSSDGHYINNNLHLARTHAWIFVADIICSEKRTVFRERSSRKTVNFEEQIMFKDKYPSTFPPQMEAIVFIILQIFFVTRAVFKIGEYSRILSSLSWGIVGHVTCFDQSRWSENVLIGSLTRCS